MKQIFYLIMVTLTAIVARAQMDIPPAGFNPGATISEEVGITSISVLSTEDLVLISRSLNSEFVNRLLAFRKQAQ